MFLQAEPSPTTGSFSMPLARHVSINADSASLPRDTTNNSTCDERSSGEFEFKPHTNAGSGSIISSSGHLVIPATIAIMVVYKDFCKFLFFFFPSMNII